MTVIQQGLQLMSQSPFQTSLSPQFTDTLQSPDPSRSVTIAASTDDFSNSGRFFKERSTLAQARDLEIQTRITGTCQDQLSSDLQSECVSAKDASFLKMNLLAEYALSQVSTDTKLMTLTELQGLQKQVSNMRETRREIESQLKQNTQIIERSIGDSDVVGTLASSNGALMERLFAMDREIREKERLLHEQSLLALGLTYVDGSHMSADLEKMEKQQQQRTASDRQADELMSYIASLAVQRNIVLPTPRGDAPEDKTQWAKDCVDSLVKTSSTELSRAMSVSATADQKKAKEQINKLKTALQDLQFAHNYLTRQYEEERNMNTSISDTDKKKRVALENKLSESIIALERANQRCILIEHEKNVLEAKLIEKTQDFHELQRQMTQLRVDNLGYVASASPLSPLSDKENTYSPAASPMTGLSVSVDTTAELPPKTPLLQQDPNSRYSTSSSPMKFQSSIGVMRGEFKKMVADLHQEYEKELEKERVERMRLEKLVKLYERRHGEDDELL